MYYLEVRLCSLTAVKLPVFFSFVISTYIEQLQLQLPKKPERK